MTNDERAKSQFRRMLRSQNTNDRILSTIIKIVDHQVLERNYLSRGPSTNSVAFVLKAILKKKEGIDLLTPPPSPPRRRTHPPGPAGRPAALSPRKNPSRSKWLNPSSPPSQIAYQERKRYVSRMARSLRFAGHFGRQTTGTPHRRVGGTLRTFREHRRRGRGRESSPCVLG